MDQVALDRLAEYFRYFSTVHAAPISPLYEVLALHVAETESLLRFAAKAKAGQPPANLLFAAVHLLLREAGKSEGLAAYYPSLGGTTSPDQKTKALFEQFILDHEAAITELISTQVTNTNEVGRAALLLPAFQLVAKESGAALELIEVGPSCGLVLCWDHYLYRFADVEIGDAQSPVCLAPDVTGARLAIESRMPKVCGRTGLEMHPVDLDDDFTLAWQQALIWPEHTDRAARFEKAFAIAKKVRPNIVPGDAVETIEAAIKRADPKAALCVHHSFVMYQIPEARRAKLSQLLCEASRDRPIWRVGVEWAGGNNPVSPTSENALGIARYRDGRVSYQRLAFCDPHGRWIEWGPAVPEDEDRL